MERNKLFIAIGVLVLLGVATFFVYRKPASEEATRVEDPWHRVDRAQVSRIVIQRAGDAPAVELEKRDNHWFMNHPGAGPADEQAIGDVLQALSEMHVASTVSREASSHAEMEVDAAHAIHVQLFHGTTADLDLFVGKNLDGGTAVRSGSAPVVYRVDRSIRFSLTKEPREWRDREITHIDRAHVRSVEWVNTRGTFHFDRNGDTWTGAAANPPIERLDTARLNQTITNLLALRAMDFAAAGANTGITATSPHVTIAVDNGPSVVIKLGGPAADGEVYVQRDGNDTVFTSGRTHGTEIDLDPANVQAPPPPAADAAVVDAGAAPAAPPSAPPMMMGGDGGGIPPQVMEQIRRQLQQRGMQMPQPH